MSALSNYAKRPASRIGFVQSSWRTARTATMAVIFLAVSLTQVHADLDYAYSGRLELIPGSALFSFFPTNVTLEFPKARNIFRLWGADLISSDLPPKLLDLKYKCDHVGTVYAQGFGQALIVSCASGGGMDLSGQLIRQGYAKEICGETANAFGTCSLQRD
jgi:hypothetical protein